MSSFIKLKDIKSALDRIQKVIHKTPVITNDTLDKLSKRKLYFKAEHLQKTGAFKARGACNAVLLEKQSGNSKGVITHSSGNHGQAVAYAARVADLPCSVVVPRGTSQVKCDAICGYGAELVFCEPTPTSRKETCAKLAAETGRAIVHPYDDYNVIAGQGTIAFELLEQVPHLDAILVPTSGGGMISGIALAAKYINPEIKVFAVEPEGKELGKSLLAKSRLWENPPKFIETIADSIRSQQCGELTFPILCDLVESDVFTVTDDQMIEGMKFAWERMKVVVEAASGAAVYAAVAQIPLMHPELQNVGVILCGGNVDLNNLPWVNKATTY